MPARSGLNPSVANCRFICVSPGRKLSLLAHGLTSPAPPPTNRSRTSRSTHGQRQACQHHRRGLRRTRQDRPEDQRRGAQGGEFRARPARYRQGARRRAKRRRPLAGESVAEESGAALVPSQRHERDPGRTGQGRVVGQGQFQVQGLERRALSQSGLPRRARLRGAPLGLYRARRGADAVLRQSRRLRRQRHHDRHLGDGRLLRADRQELPYLRRRRYRRRARATCRRAR